MNLVNNLLLPLGLGVAASLIAAWVWARYASALPTLSSENSQSLSGTWVARVPYSNLPDKIGIEFFRLEEARGNVRFYKEHHNSKLPKPGAPKKLRGYGIARGPLFSAYFYLADKSAYASGTMTLRQMNTSLGPPVLQGVYTQLIDRLNEKVQFLTEEYNLVRISLPLNIQLRRLFGQPYFPSFRKAQAYYNNLPEEIRNYAEQGLHTIDGNSKTIGAMLN